MSNEIFGGLLWCNRAGAFVQALDLAARSDRSNRKHQIEDGVIRSREEKFGGEGFSLPIPVAAAGLTFLGFVLGATLVATIVS